MKRLLLCVAWCLLGLSLSAQSVQYTYWFDDQLDVRITDSLTSTSHLQIEASHLPTGFHTMFMLLGSDSTVRLETAHNIPTGSTTTMRVPLQAPSRASGC